MCRVNQFTLGDRLVTLMRNSVLYRFQNKCWKLLESVSLAEFIASLSTFLACRSLMIIYLFRNVGYFVIGGHQLSKVLTWGERSVIGTVL